MAGIVFWVNISVRLSPAFLPFAKNEAQNFVESGLVKDARALIDKEFADLSGSAKAKAAKALVNKWKKEKKESTDAKISEKQQEIKSYWQDEYGKTFLLEIDPYHWLRLVKDFVARNSIDNFAGKDQYDSFMLAPLGMKKEVSLHKNFHVYLSGVLFKFLRIFNPNILLSHFVFYIPVAVVILVLAAALLMCYSISKNKFNLSGIFAVMALGSSHVFLTRSLAGWFDTDPYIVLFSILTVCAFYSSLNGALPAYLRFSLSAIGGLCIGLFSFTWDGWWYMFDLVVLSGLCYLANLYLIKKKGEAKTGLRSAAALLLVFALSSVFFVSAFSGWPVFTHSAAGLLKIIFAKGYLQNQFWPNTFLTVGELRRVSLLDALKECGGYFLFLLGLIYWLIVFFTDKKNKNYTHKQFLAFLFIFWILTIVYASTRAVRFSLLSVAPIAISFGLCIERLVEFLAGFIRRKINMPYAKEAVAILFFGIFMHSLLPSGRLILTFKPMMHRQWYEVLKKIRAQTPENAIINSWWDFGHWFKEVSGRRVIFDGATQNTPMAYWMARALLSDNELEAMGILRMLNSGGNKAFEEIESLGIDKHKCIDILNEITLLKYEDAKEALGKYIPDEQDRERVLKYTHNPQPAYFIIDSTLLDKMTTISFFGGWNFKKADIYQKFRELGRTEFTDYLMERYRYSREGALKLYDALGFLNADDALTWISPMSRYHFESKVLSREDNLLLFNNCFMDINNRYAYLYDLKSGKWRSPKKIFYNNESGILQEVNLKSSELDFALLLLKEQDDHRIIALDEKLVHSMFTRLYYLNGAQLKYFHPVITEDLKDGRGRIAVYKIEWDEN